jgi:hypothetical protein
MTFIQRVRFQAREAVRHPWFREYPYPKKPSEMPACPVGGALPSVRAPVIAGATKGSVAVIGRIKPGMKPQL